MKIRLWKLGHLDTENPCNSIIPTKQTIDILREKLREMLNSDGKIMDLIWGPDLECTVIDGNEDKILLPHSVDENGNQLYILDDV